MTEPRILEIQRLLRAARRMGALIGVQVKLNPEKVRWFNPGWLAPASQENPE